MKSILLVVLWMSVCVALSMGLSCFNLDQRTARGDICYIERNQELDSYIVGPMGKCTPKDLTNGTIGNVVNANYCYMAVFLANVSQPVPHSMYFVQRGAGISKQNNAVNCTQQCKLLASTSDIGMGAPITRSLVHFSCGYEENSNGQNATLYNARTVQFNCNEFKELILTSSAATQVSSSSTMTPAQSSGIWWIWWIVGVVVVLAVVLIVGVVVYLYCARKQKAELGHAAYTAAPTPAPAPN